MSLLSIFKRAVLTALLILSNTLNAGSPEALTLQAATELAVQDNPGLAQIKARAQAMAAIPSQVGTLPDPVLSFSALNLPTDTFDTRQEPMTQMQVGISQTIPFPGKLSLREQAASYEAAAALQDVTEARHWLLRNVKNLWWRIFYLDHALQIVESNRILLKQFIQIASTKYEVGEGLQQDVLLAQLELSRLLDQRLNLKNAWLNSAARLNSLLNRMPNSPLLLPESTDQQLPTLASETVLYQQADEFRALLAAKREAVHAAQSRLELAKKDFYPDFTVGAAYGGRDDSASGTKQADFLSMKLSMALPIFAGSKQAKAVDQRTSELMQKRYALQDEHNNVHAQISQAYNDFQRAKEQFLLFKTGIIPQARQTVASMLAGYQVNKVDFLNLVRSQITLFNYEMQYWNVFAEANQALAQLSATVGKDDIYE
ncbi:MAG: TolC family protein [Gammaproteobacteria bacterium]